MAVKKLKIVDTTLYKWRYPLGYAFLTIIFCLSLTIVSLYSPGGMSPAELASLKATNDISLNNITSLAQANLPFYLLQKLIFSIFGISVYTIKLPSLIIAFVTAITIFLLLRRWFKPNITILSLAIMTITGQLLFIAQSATTQILYIAFTSVILLLSSLIIQKKMKAGIYRILLAIVISLSLFTPYFWYINLMLLLAAAIHPHTRYILFSRKYRIHWLPAIATVFILTLPIVILGIINPGFLKNLLGIYTLQWDIINNLKIILYSFFWIKPTVIAWQIAPILDMSALMLIILGGAGMLKKRHTARSYMIGLWLLLCLPLIIFNPVTLVIITMPLFILLATGVELLLSSWYSLFPKNPYARVTGLLFLICLIGVMTLSGIDRFINGYRHMPEAATGFNVDINLAKEAIKKYSEPTIVVTSDELPLYQLLAKYSKKRISVREDYSGSKIQIISRSFLNKSPVPENFQLKSIATDSKTNNSDRFYIYKND